MSAPRQEGGSDPWSNTLIYYQTTHNEDDFVYEENAAPPPENCWFVLLVSRRLVHGVPRCFFTINREGYFRDLPYANAYVLTLMDRWNAQEVGEAYAHSPKDQRLDMRRFDDCEENWYGCSTQYKSGNTIYWEFCKDFYPVNEPVLWHPPVEQSEVDEVALSLENFALFED
jgi:hypothetical protein